MPSLLWHRCKTLHQTPSVLNPVRAKMVSDAAQYHWSSYLATMGDATTPEWLHTDWVLSQFGKSRASARRKYAKFVAKGVGIASPWNELKGQVLLGNEQFICELQPLLDGKSELKEFPRAQRLMNRPALKTLFSAKVRASKILRDEAICKACIEHG